MAPRWRANTHGCVRKAVFLGFDAMHAFLCGKRLSGSPHKIASCMAFGNPTWLHFVKVLGAKLKPNWQKSARKVDQKKYKNYNILDRSWTDLWWTLACITSTPKGVRRSGFWSSLGGLGYSWLLFGPRLTPDLSKILQAGLCR